MTLRLLRGRAELALLADWRGRKTEVPRAYFLLNTVQRPRFIDSITTSLHRRKRAAGTNGRADTVRYPPWGTGAMRLTVCP